MDPTSTDKVGKDLLHNCLTLDVGTPGYATSISAYACA